MAMDFNTYSNLGYLKFINLVNILDLKPIGQWVLLLASFLTVDLQKTANGSLDPVSDQLVIRQLLIWSNFGPISSSSWSVGPVVDQLGSGQLV